MRPSDILDSLRFLLEEIVSAIQATGDLVICLASQRPWYRKRIILRGHLWFLSTCARGTLLAMSLLLGDTLCLTTMVATRASMVFDMDAMEKRIARVRYLSACVAYRYLFGEDEEDRSKGAGDSMEAEKEAKEQERASI